MIPALNISGDMELTKLVEECEALTKHPADTLRINKEVRKDVVTQAMEILKKMESYI